MEETPAPELFISHASEDKDPFVRALANALMSFGVRVWYDEFELKLGDSLSRSIDEGLSRTAFGLVVLSKSFFAKRWTEYELRGLTAREVAAEGKVILPVWLGVTKEDVLKFSPPLADKYAVVANRDGDVRSVARKTPRLGPSTMHLRRMVSGLRNLKMSHCHPHLGIYRCRDGAS